MKRGSTGAFGVAGTIRGLGATGGPDFFSPRRGETVVTFETPVMTCADPFSDRLLFVDCLPPITSKFYSRSQASTEFSQHTYSNVVDRGVLYRPMA